MDWLETGRTNLSTLAAYTSFPMVKESSVDVGSIIRIKSGEDYRVKAIPLRSMFAKAEKFYCRKLTNGEFKTVMLEDIVYVHSRQPRLIPE